jgi:hypothetical protein
MSNYEILLQVKTWNKGKDILNEYYYHYFIKLFIDSNGLFDYESQE